MNPGKKLNSVHERHIDVGQQYVNFLFFKHLQRFLSIGGLQNILPDIHPRKQHPNALSLYHFVIYNQICVHVVIPLSKQHYILFLLYHFSFKIV